MSDAGRLGALPPADPRRRPSPVADPGNELASQPPGTFSPYMAGRFFVVARDLVAGARQVRRRSACAAAVVAAAAARAAAAAAAEAVRTPSAALADPRSHQIVADVEAAAAAAAARARVASAAATAVAYDLQIQGFADPRTYVSSSSKSHIT